MAYASAACPNESPELSHASPVLAHAQVPQGSAHGFRDMKRIKCYYPNTVVNIVKSPAWQTLLLRLGPTPQPRHCDVAYNIQHDAWHGRSGSAECLEHAHAHAHARAPSCRSDV